MHSPLASRTLLLVPDSRQTALAAFAVAGLDQAAYSAYGHQSRAPAFRTGFNGQPREALGWYHLGNGHRVYNPVLMRFHSADHLSPFDKGGLNPYAYCHGDPVSHVDPTGQFAEWLMANPLHSFSLNTGLLAMNVLMLFASKLTTLGVIASLVGGGGAAAGATALGLQQAGVEDGRNVSVIGTLVSFAGTGLKIGLMVKTIAKEPAEALARFKTNMSKLGFGKKNATSVKSPSTSPKSTPPLPPSLPGQGNPPSLSFVSTNGKNSHLVRKEWGNVSEEWRKRSNSI